MPRHRSPRIRRPTPPAQLDVIITRIGADGDGVGTTAEGQTVYAPFTVPGDHIRATPIRPLGHGWLARAETWIAHGADTADAPCPHFGACGGCALQHWAALAYQAWKSSLLRMALIRAGFDDPALDPLVLSAPGTRRRMDLAARRRPAPTLGLHRMRSPEVVDLSTCAVLHPSLIALLPALKDLLAGLSAPWRQASVIANLLDSGPDLLIRADQEPTVEDRAHLATFARQFDLPRIAWGGDSGPVEPVAQLRPAETSLSGVTIAPPPGAFLQATAAGELAIIQAVLAGLPERLPPRARIAEFHAGCGTLTFALARHAHVQAWEGDADAVATLNQAANRAGLMGRVRAERRDLARQPLQAKELAGFAAVVLDPPHAGAAEQMGPIAASGVGTVIYVGCNPATLARDAAVLRAAGYRLQRGTPIDQFLWSARLESVNVFHRDGR